MILTVYRNNSCLVLLVCSFKKKKVCSATSTSREILIHTSVKQERKSDIIMGNWVSRTSMSFENLCRILPEGVTSKKLTGAFNTFRKSKVCNLRAACIQPTANMNSDTELKIPVTIDGTGLKFQIIRHFFKFRKKNASIHVHLTITGSIKISQYDRSVDRK